MAKKHSFFSKIKTGLALLEQRQWPILTFFCLVNILIFLFVFPSGGPDVEGYYEYASLTREGQLPYRDFSLEYPPGAFMVFFLPRLFTSSLEAYGQAFAIEMLVFNLIGLLGAMKLGQQLGQKCWKTGLLYTLAVLAIGDLVVQRYDLAPAALTLLAILFFCQKHYNIAWAFLAIGTMTKLYPAALAPLFFVYQLKHYRWQQLIIPIVIFLLVILDMARPFIFIDIGGFIEAFTVQGSRDLQVESVYASLLLLGQMLGIGTAQVYQGRYSVDVEAPLSQPLAQYSFAVTAVCLLITYALFWRRQKNTSGNNVSLMVNTSLLVTTILLITSKVFSAQFIIWLLPLIALVDSRQIIWTLFIITAGLTYYIYPMHYGELMDMQSRLVIILFIRNLLMIAIAILTARKIWSRPPSIKLAPSIDDRTSLLA